MEMKYQKTFEDSDCEPEVVFLHRVDIVVRDSGIAPDRNSLADLEKMRKMDQGRSVYNKVFG